MTTQNYRAFPIDRQRATTQKKDHPAYAGYYHLVSTDGGKDCWATASGNAQQRRTNIRVWKRQGWLVEQQMNKVQKNDLGIYMIVGTYYREV